MANSSGRIKELAKTLSDLIDKEYANLTEIRLKLFEELEQERDATQFDYERRYVELKELEKEVNRKKELLEEKEKIDLEFVMKNNDVIKVNVSGQIFQMKRKTLTSPFPDSFLARLFSGRWDDNIERDGEGNFFLDMDPWGFSMLINYFREKGMETPDSVATFPFIPLEKRDSFLNMLDYLGLRHHLQVRGQDDIEKGKASAWWDWRLKKNKTADLTPQSSPVPTPSRPVSLSTTEASVERKKEKIEKKEKEKQGLHLDDLHDEDAPADAPLLIPQELTNIVVEPRGWSKMIFHPNAVFDGPSVTLPDTRSEQGAAAVRGVRGFSGGMHSWSIEILSVSDPSYIGFVSDTWSHVHRAVGKCYQSWSVSSNGKVWVERREDEEHVIEFGNGAQMMFVVDMDKKTVNVMINGRQYPNLFTGLPDVIYPAVSNSRAPCSYAIRYP